MKKCPKCKNEYPDDKKFCKICRVQLVEIEEGSILSENREIIDKSDQRDLKPEYQAEEKKYSSSEPVKVKTGSSKIYLISGAVFVAVIIIIVMFSSADKNISQPTNNINNTTSYSSTPSETKSSNAEENTNLDYSIDYESMVTDTINWSLSRKYIFDHNGNPRNKFISDFISKLESFKGDGVPVTRSEFEGLLEKPEARLIYISRLIRYATPVSEEIQKKEHEDYTKIFLKEKRVVQGIKFLHDYETVLSQAETNYNIPRKDLVSILMWESGLGEFTGDYQIFNVFLEQLAMLDYAQEYAVRQMKISGQDNPLDDPLKRQKENKRLEKRREDAAKNLAVLLRLCKLSQQDPLLQKGSWGGAIGFVQFMPYNLKYAVDGDNNGVIDLSNFSDAIYSAANYLRESGKYGSSENSRQHAIFTYNRSQEYVTGVIAYAEAIWTRYSAGE